MKTLLCLIFLTNLSVQAEAAQYVLKGYTGTTPQTFEFTVMIPTGTPGKRTLKLKMGDSIAGVPMAYFRQIIRYAPPSRSAMQEPVDESELVFTDYEKKRTITLVFNKPVLVDEPQ